MRGINMDVKKDCKALWNYLSDAFEMEEIVEGFTNAIEGFEYDPRSINDEMIDSLKEEIERVEAILYFRAKLKNARLERSEQEFWNRLNITREVDKKDILGYAQLKEDLNSLDKYNEHIGAVCNESFKMLGEIENLIKQLL